MAARGCGVVPLRVAINGAGPAGLVAASILARAPKPGFRVEVFERDARERDQGAGWDISREAMKAFEKAGLDWRTIAREGSDTWRIFKVGEPSPLFVVTPPEFLKRLFGGGSPETNRHAMREGLLSAMAGLAQVRFGCKVAGASPLQDGTLLLRDAEGSDLGVFDVVIDASGMHSPLRKQRIDEAGPEQYYNGLTMVNGIVRDPEEMLDPELVRMLGQGTLEVIGDCASRDGGFTMLLQRYGSQLEDRRAKFQSLFACTKPGELANALELRDVPLSSIDAASYPAAADRIKHLLKRQFGDKWPQMYHDLVDALDHLQVYDLYQYPSDARLREDAPLGLVCIGDALHAMSPTSGSGGNLAVQDASDLAAFLIASQGQSGFKLGLRDLEKKFLARMAEPAKMGHVTAGRFKNVLQAETPICEWSSDTFARQFDDFPIPFVKYILKFFQVLHRREGYGMPPRPSRL